MTRTAEEQPEAKPANQPGDRHTSPARAALADLVTLSATTAAREIEIEKVRVVAIDQAEKELARVKSNLDLRVKAVREELDQKYSARIDEIGKQYVADLADLNAKDKEHRRRLSAEHDRIQEEVKGKTQQALWLAESMLEGVQAGLKEESKNAKEEHAKQLETLDDLERQADALIVSYRQKPPTDVAIPIEKIEGKPDDALQASQQEAERRLAELKSLSLPHLFGGIKPFVIALLVCAAAGAIADWVNAGHPTSSTDLSNLAIDPKSIGIGVGGALVFLCGLGAALYFVAKSQIHKTMMPFKQAAADARVAAKAVLDLAAEQRSARRSRATTKRNVEVEGIKAQHAPVLNRAVKTRDAGIAAVQIEYNRSFARIESRRDKSSDDNNAWKQQNIDHVEQRYQQEVATATERYDASLRDAEAKFDSDNQRCGTSGNRVYPTFKRRCRSKPAPAHRPR